ncbi:hypothetical protein BH11ACT8_BH11ACT8_23620 [soil metagenome]
MIIVVVASIVVAIDSTRVTDARSLVGTSDWTLALVGGFLMAAGVLACIMTAHAAIRARGVSTPRILGMVLPSLLGVLAVMSNHPRYGATPQLDEAGQLASFIVSDTVLTALVSGLFIYVLDYDGEGSGDG